MKEIDRVVYNAQTGPILPKLQWSEEITITADEVTLTRKAAVEISHVHAGRWSIPVEPTALTDLFDRLQGLDCSRIKRVEASDPPDGGSSEGYTVYYKNGDHCSLYYDPGTRYEGGDQIALPVKDFIESLNLPLAAQSKYLER